MDDVAIIGGGLFGSIIARALLSIGREVTVYDDNREEAGSKPAACLMRPSWFTSLGKSVYEPSLKLLDQLYGVKDIAFKVGPLITTTVLWVSPKKLLSVKKVRSSVLRINQNGKNWRLTFRSGTMVDHKLVIVASGIWSQLLVPEISQRGWAGMAFLWPDQEIEVPFVKLWAPYKQIVAFNRGDGLWSGDGTAILRGNWTDARAEKSFKRCNVGKGEPTRLFGIRPYHTDKPCLLKEVRPALWVASGGAKNGTLAAGWCAHVLSERLC